MKKIKIEIKHWITGSVLFEYESEGNTILETVKKAVSEKKDLTGADLRGAYLRGAYLRGAYLTGADLRGAYLTGADLRGADLRGAYLRGSDLTGADKIKTSAVFTGLYKYIVIPYFTESGDKLVKMGCYDRLLSEWESDFWNNDAEFPNNGSLDSELRVMAFEVAKKWFEIIEKQNDTH